eukprot:Pgem_evm1s750
MFFSSPVVNCLAALFAVATVLAETDVIYIGSKSSCQYMTRFKREYEFDCETEQVDLDNDGDMEIDEYVSIQKFDDSIGTFNVYYGASCLGDVDATFVYNSISNSDTCSPMLGLVNGAQLRYVKAPVQFPKAVFIGQSSDCSDMTRVIVDHWKDCESATTDGVGDDYVSLKYNGGTEKFDVWDGYTLSCDLDEKKTDISVDRSNKQCQQAGSADGHALRSSANAVEAVSIAIGGANCNNAVFFDFENVYDCDTEEINGDYYSIKLKNEKWSMFNTIELYEGVNCNSDDFLGSLKIDFRDTDTSMDTCTKADFKIDNQDVRYAPKARSIIGSAANSMTVNSLFLLGSFAYSWVF